LGTTTTSFVFLGAILCVVIYLSRTERDQPAIAAPERYDVAER
jgi:uncharacterized membrane-anchored protein